MQAIEKVELRKINLKIDFGLKRKNKEKRLGENEGSASTTKREKQRYTDKVDFPNPQIGLSDMVKLSEIPIQLEKMCYYCIL